MSDKKLSLEDIFNDDEMGLLESKAKQSNVKTENQRLIDSFEEINQFYEREGEEPGNKTITEYKLASRLKSLRDDPAKIEVLKEQDRFNLLKAEKKIESVEDILKDDSGLLDTDESLSIFKLRNIPSSHNRSETDFVAQRKPMNKKEFQKYEADFKRIHKELREGKRSLISFKYEALKPREFYVSDGIMLYLESVDWERNKQTFNSGTKIRPDGRTHVIFENGTHSRMMFQSLYKSLHENGRMVTRMDSELDDELYRSTHLISEEDQETGWMYVLKSKSTHPELSVMENLYKIGYSRVPVKDRIKNATKESTYLNADVEIIATYKCYNVNPQKFENLLHRFFSEVCLMVDIHDSNGRRITPREWFVVPIGIIEKTIRLILSGEIINYYYDSENQVLNKKV